MTSTPQSESTFARMLKKATPSGMHRETPKQPNARFQSTATATAMGATAMSPALDDKDFPPPPVCEMGEDFYAKNGLYNSPVPRSYASSSVVSLASDATGDDNADQTAVAAPPPRPGSSLSKRSPSVPTSLSRAAESSTSVNSLASSSGGAARSFLSKSQGQSSSEKEGSALKGIRAGLSRGKEALSSGLSSSLKRMKSGTTNENAHPEDYASPPAMGTLNGSTRAGLTRMSSDERPATTSAQTSSHITPAARGLLTKSTSRFTNRPHAQDTTLKARPRRAQRVLVEDGNDGGSEGGEASQDTPPLSSSEAPRVLSGTSSTASPPVHLRTRSDLVPASPKIAPPPERAAATVSIPAAGYVSRSASALGNYGDSSSSPLRYAELGSLPLKATSSSLTSRSVSAGQSSNGVLHSTILRRRYLQQSSAAARAAGSSPEDGPSQSRSSPDLSPPQLGLVARSQPLETRRGGDMLQRIDEKANGSNNHERRSPPNSQQYEDSGATLQPRSQSSLGFSTSAHQRQYVPDRPPSQQAHRPLQIYADENAGAPATAPSRSAGPARPVLGETHRANSAALLPKTVQTAAAAVVAKRQQEVYGYADYQAPLRDGSPGIHVEATPSMTVQSHYTSQSAAAYQHQQQQQRQAYPPMQPPPPVDQALPPKPVKKSAGLISVNGKVYHRAGILGKGGSSRVYRVLDEKNNLFAVKKVDLRMNDLETRASFINEIHLLEKLRGHPQIITLIDSEVNDAKKTLSMVMEVGETDLHNLLNEHAGKAISLNFIRYIWEQMLEAVQVIHDENVVHTDLKPANFVLVKGRLKLIDFGISKAIGNDTTNISRDQQIGSANYMSPEALLDSGLGYNGKRLMKLGRAADVWSLGCILHQMVYGRTPFAHIRDIGQKIAAIQNPNYVISYPATSCPLDDRGEEKRELAVKIGPDLLDAMKSCLRFEKDKRATIPDLLKAPFLRREGGGAAALGTSPSSTSPASASDADPTINAKLMAAVVKRICNAIRPDHVSDENVKKLATKLMSELRAAQANV